MIHATNTAFPGADHGAGEATGCRDHNARAESAHRHSVLVCDTDPQSIRALKAVLRAADFAVTTTQTASEALTRAALQVPDLAILEMDLADASGAEVCRQLRQWGSMPLIIVSHVSDENRVVDVF